MYPRWHSHIGRIRLHFLHCALSNVSSNWLPGRMHNHTGCMYATFLHCGFLNVSSNCLPEWMQSHTGCICLTFLQKKCFQMCPLENQKHELSASQTNESSVYWTQGWDKKIKYWSYVKASCTVGCCCWAQGSLGFRLLNWWWTGTLPSLCYLGSSTDDQHNHWQ